MSSSTFSPHANSTMSDTINDTYVTAIEDSPTQYLSVLESTNEEAELEEEAISLDNLNNMTVTVEHMNVDEDNDVIVEQQQYEEDGEEEGLNLVCSDDGGGDMTLTGSVGGEEASNGQIVVFTLEGSDDYYGVQVAQDEDGNFHRYQFQFRKSDDGQLEAIPESIQLLPDEDDQPGQLQQQQLVENSTEDHEDRGGVMILGDSESVNVQNIMEIQQQQEQRPQHQQYQDDFQAAIIHETEIHLTVGKEEETEAEDEPEDQDEEEEIEIEQKVLPEQHRQGLQTASSGLRIFIGEDQQHCGERILPDDDNDDAYEDHNENADLERAEESHHSNQHYFHGDGYVVETEEHQRQGLEQQPNPKAEICEEQDEDEDQERVDDDAAAETTVDVKPTGFMHMKQELIDENTSEEFARERESFVANEHNLILNEALTTNDNRQQEDNDHYQEEEGLGENNDVIGLSQPQQDHVQYDIQYEQEEQQDGAADTEEEEEEGGDQDRDPDEVYEGLNDSSEADQDQDQEDGCLGELDDREGNFVGVQTEQPQLQQSEEEEEEEFVFDINMEINEPICEITSSEDHNNCQSSSNNSDRDLGQLRHLTIHSNSSGETCGGGEDEHEEGEDQDYDNIDDDENSAEIGEHNLENRKMDEEMEEEAIPETTQDFCQGLVAEEDQQIQFVHAAIQAATLDSDSRHGDDDNNDYFRDDQQMAHNLGKGVFSAVTTDRLNNVMIAKKIVNHEKPMMVMGERTYQYLQQQQQQNTKLEDSKLLLYFVHPEKENVDALSFNAGNNNMNNNNNNAPHAVYGKASKTNPRSILKSSHLSGAGSIAQQIPQQQQQQPKLLPQAAQKHHLLPNAVKKPILLQDLAVASAYQEKLAAKRFARGKEATQARILQNFINRTTIPQAPVRTKRLPRKQKIKPVERLGGEEIVVQEVMISSEGFVEAVCTSGGGRMNKRSKQRVTEYVELTDSEEEYVATSKRSRKHDSTKTITISDTEDETTRDSVIDLEAPPEDTTASSGSSPPTDGSTSLGTRSGTKRRRGRPPKKSTNGKKASSAAAAAMVTGSSGQAISPVEDSGMGSDTASNVLFAKTEIPCTVCSKTFASPNSLKTHLQHHTLENSMKNVNNAATTDSTCSKPSNASDKYKCERCGAAFKNSALLTRHACSTSAAASGKVDGDIKKKNIDTNSGMVKCAVCKKSFPNTTTLNVHKRVHVKEMLAKQTLAHMTPPKNKKLTQQLPKSPTANSKTTVQAVTTTSSGMIKCTMCKKTFPNMTTLSVHKRVHAKEMLAKQTLLAQTATPPKTRKSQPQTQPQQTSASSSSSSNEPKKVHSRESGSAVFKLPAVRKKMVSSAGAGGGSSSDNASLFRCNVCRKVCPSQQTLTAHQKIHKELTCATCGKCFSNRLILAQHLRSGNCSGGGGVSKSPKSNRSPTNSSNKVKRRSPRSKSSSCLTDVMATGCHDDADNNPETTLNNTTRASTSFVRRSKTSMSLTNDLNCDLCSMQFSSKIALKSHKLVKHPTTEGSAASTPSKNSTGNSANKRTSSIRRQHCGIPATSRFARAFQGIRELNFDDNDDHQ